MKRTGLLILIAMVGVTASMDASSTIITWRASGTVDLLAGWQNTLPYEVAVGDAFAFEFAFDTDAPDTNLDPTFGQYWPPAPSMMSLQLGANFMQFDLATSLAATNVLNNYYFDDFPGGERDGFQLGATQLYADGSSFATEVILHDDRPYVYDEWGAPSITEGPLTSDALPSTLLDLNDFPTRRSLYVSHYIPNVSAGGLFGTVTSLVAVPAPATSVPEPGTLALLGIGLAALGFGVRRGIEN